MDVHGVVDHVGLAQELDLRLEDLLVGIELPLLEELQHREHQMPVEIWRDPRREVVRSHCCVFFVRPMEEEEEEGERERGFLYVIGLRFLSRSPGSSIVNWITTHPTRKLIDTAISTR